MSNFEALDYFDFKEQFLVEKLLDKMPAPRLTGDAEKIASDANIKIADKLNRLLDRLYKSIKSFVQRKINNNPDLEVNLIKNEMEDWVQKGAAILNIELDKTGAFTRPLRLTVVIYDNNNIRLALPNEIVKLFKKSIGGRYKGSTALDKVIVDLRRILDMVL